jgi:UDP-glucose 4-epimerase
MKKILVTGATGYIGSHVCKVLKQHGYHVTGWDINIHGEYNNITPYIDDFREWDITHYVRGSFDCIVHLAARGSVPVSLREPTDYYRVNAMGTANVLDRIENDHFIFASSSSVFSMVSPYARSKMAAEDIIKEKSSNYTIFRFFNVSGTDGINHQLAKTPHLIKAVAQAIIGKRDFVINGTNYPTRDGTCIRDYVHVLDVANAIVTAIEAGPQNTPYECIGSAKGYSVLDVIRAMEKVTNIKLMYKVGSPREGDAVSAIVNNLSSLVKLEKTLEDMCWDQYCYELKN